MRERERLDGFEPVSPELVLVDPELAARLLMKKGFRLVGETDLRTA